MMTIVIDLTEHQWLALLGAFALGAGFAWLFLWPLADRRGYERRSREKAEEVEGILNNRREMSDA